MFTVVGFDGQNVTVEVSCDLLITRNLEKLGECSNSSWSGNQGKNCTRKSDEAIHCQSISLFKTKYLNNSTDVIVLSSSIGSSNPVIFTFRKVPGGGRNWN